MTDELDVLRAYGVDDPEPPPDLAMRIESRLLEQAALEDDQRAAHYVRRRSSTWRSFLLRQAPVAMAAASLIVVLSFDQGRPGGQPAQATSGASTFLSNAADTAQSEPVSLQSVDPVVMASAPSAETNVISNGQTAGAPNASPRGTRRTLMLPPTEPSIPDPIEMSMGPSGLDSAQLYSIPTDERLLLRMLRDATSGSDTHDADFAPFRIAASYVASDRVPGPVRAAFLRTVALMDGVDLGGDSVDVAGRIGVVVARLDSSSGVRQQYLFDAPTSQLLEHREFTTSGDFGNCSAGTVVHFDLYDDSGNRIPREAFDQTWPDVEAVCSP